MSVILEMSKNLLRCYYFVWCTQHYIGRHSQYICGLYTSLKVRRFIHMFEKLHVNGLSSNSLITTLYDILHSQ